MSGLEFNKSREANLNVYRFFPEGERVMGNHWPPERWKRWDSTAESPLTEYSVVSSNQAIVVYLGMCWRLLNEKSCFGIPVFESDAAEQILHQPPAIVRWEYRIDPREMNPVARDKGFMSARTAITVESTDVTPSDMILMRERDASLQRAGLFRLERFNDLTGLCWSASMDDFGELNLFGIHSDAIRYQELLAALSGDMRPDLESIIRDDEIFITIAFGTDSFVYKPPAISDSITVFSKIELGDQLEILTSEYRERIAHYESAVDKVDDMLDFLECLHHLSGIVV